MIYGEKNVAITGIGLSEVGRPAQASPRELALRACLAAIQDAGLNRSDIDGIATWPGFLGGTSGMSDVAIHDIRIGLDLKLNWFTSGRETPGQFGAIFDAIGAINAGFARHVLVFRAISEASARKRNRNVILYGVQERASGIHEWLAPFGAVSPVSWFALYAQRHFYEFGTTREQLAHIALNARRNARRNPAAPMRDPLDLDTYLSARMISSPLCLFDCDVPVDAAVALVLSHKDAARDLRNQVLRFEAIGSAIRRGDTWFRPDDLTETSSHDAAAMMWSRTDLTPAAVDVAELYDGFSIHTMLWLEALGFCGRGESGPYVEGGHRIALDGELPLNTHGGQLSGGRLHGLGFAHEACVQLWGRGGARQVQPQPRVAVAAAGLGVGFTGCLLIVRD